ncbi:MAG: hypothetical protein U1E95_03925 [Rubrivivax sp.]
MSADYPRFRMNDDREVLVLSPAGRSTSEGWTCATPRAAPGSRSATPTTAGRWRRRWSRPACWAKPTPTKGAVGGRAGRLRAAREAALVSPAAGTAAAELLASPERYLKRRPGVSADPASAELGDAGAAAARGQGPDAAADAVRERAPKLPPPLAAYAWPAWASRRR